MEYKNLKQWDCIFKCTQIILYNFVPLCKYKCLKGSVVVSMVDSYLDYFFNTHIFLIRFYFSQRCIHQCCKQTHTDWKGSERPFFSASLLSLFSVCFLFTFSQSCWDYWFLLVRPASSHSMPPMHCSAQWNSRKEETLSSFGGHSSIDVSLRIIFVS